MVPSPPRRRSGLPGRSILVLLAGVLLTSFAGTGSRDPLDPTRAETSPALPPIVLSVLPTGPTEVRNSVVVIFARPMAPLGSPAPSIREGERYFRIRPRPRGTYRWVGTRTLSYVVPDGLTPATQFRGTVRGDAKALDGTRVGTDIEWTFHTPGPKLLQAYPTGNSFHVRPEDWFVFAFDQPVAPRELARRLHLDGVRRWVAEVPEDGDLAGDRNDFRWFPEGHVLRARPDPPLTLDTAYHLILDRDLTGRLGDMPMGEDAQILFRTYGPLRLRRSSWSFLRFTNAVDPESLRTYMTISPDPGKLDLGAYSRETFSFSLGTLDSARATLSPRLPDIFGQRLGHRVTLLLHSPPPRNPFRLTPAGGSFPLGAPRRVVFDAPAGEGVAVRAARVSPREAHRFPAEPALFPHSRNATEWYHGTWDLERSYPDSSAVRDTLDLSSLASPGAPGAVLVEAEGKYPKERHFLIRSVITWSNFDVLAHMSERKGVAWVLRRDDGSPVPGARLSVWRGQRDQSHPVWSARTDADGLATLPIRGSLLIERSDDGVTVPWWPWLDFHRMDRMQGFGWQRFQENRAFVFGDRAIYRPGDTLRVCGMVRRTTTAGLELPDSLRIKVRINIRPDPVDTLLDLDAMGGFHLEWRIPATIRTGRLQVIFFQDAKRYRRLATRDVTVEEYRAPDFSTRVVSGPEDLFPDGAVTSRIEATYYFGTPVAGARVTWSLRARPRTYRDPLYPDFSFRNPGIRNRTRGQLLEEDGVLSRQGALAVTRRLPSDLPSFTQDLQIEAVVRSPTGDAVAARDTIRFHPASVIPGIRMIRRYSSLGDTVVARILAVDPVTGKTIPGRRLRVEWRRIRQWIDGFVPGSPALEDSVIASVGVVSGTSPDTVRWKPPAAGRYWLRVQATDGRGRSTAAGVLFHVSGPVSRRAVPRKPPSDLHLEAADTTWEPGDTLQVYLEAPSGARRALVTVERETVLDARIQNLAPGANVIQVPVRAEYRPNAYVGISIPAPPVSGKRAPESIPVAELPAARVGYQPFRVETESRHLRVTVKPDRPAYAPGDTVRVKVRVLAQDGPAPHTWVSVQAVDRAVLALMAPERPDPFPFFYRSRALEVGLADSRTGPRPHVTRDFQACGISSSEADLSRATGFSIPRVRKHFVTTCLWAPGRRTDAQGAATLTFVCPDNLTEFRLTAVAAAWGDRFGAGTAVFRVRRRLAVEPALPRFLRTGDRVDLAAVVVNDTGEEVRGSLELEAPGIRLRSGSSLPVRLQPGQSTRVAFPARVPDGGGLDTSRVVFHLKAAGSGDAVETPLPVVPLRVPRVAATAGHTRTTAREVVRLPVALIPNTATLDLTLANSALAGSERAFQYVRRYPYGCLEQMSSRLLAQVCFKNLMTASTDTSGSARLDAQIRETLHSLDEFYQGNGHFSFWQNQSQGASPYLNGYALFALLAARRAGFSVRPDLAMGASEILAEISGVDEIQRMPAGWILFVATELQRGGVRVRPFSDLSDLAVSYADSLSEESRLFLALSLRNTPEGGPLLRSEMDRVRNRLILTAGSAYLPAFGEPRINGAFCSAGRATALALLLAVADGDEEIAARLAVGLLDRRRDGHWKNTQADALALWALDRYRVAFEPPQAELPVAVRLPELGIDLQETLPAGYSRIAPRVNLGALEGGRAAPLLFDNLGTGRLYYTGTVRWDEDPRLQAPHDHGLAVERRVEPLLRPARGGRTPRVGDLLVVTLILSVPEESRYLAIRDPLPAGLEPVIRRLQVESRGAGMTFAGLRRDYAPLPISHLDLRDQEVRVFADAVPAGIYEFRYLVRARAAGTFTQPPATVEAMYSPEQNGASGPGRVVIGPPEK